MSMEKLMIIDGNSILNRAFYGLQGKQMLATSDGLYTNAVFGFLNILYRYLDEEKPQYLCVAFDMKAPTFRHKEFDGYKATRKGMPEELAVQMPVIKEVLDAMNIKRLEYEGFEADDIIGSVSFCAEKKGMEVVIVTGDRDSLQLAGEATRIKLPVTKGGRTETEEYDVKKVFERYGVSPEQFIDIKGLMGDTSDNIPGVPGIGEKTAMELVAAYGSIENLYQNLDSVAKKGVKDKLEAGKDLAFISKRLATIDRNMPELCAIEDLKRKGFNNEELYKLFQRLEFKSLIEKFKLGAIEEKAVFVTRAAECAETAEDYAKIKDSILSSGECSMYFLIDHIDEFKRKLAGAAFSWEKEKSIYICLNDESREEEFLRIFKEIFETESVKKYAHDIKEAIVYLKNNGIDFKGLNFDTMIGAYIIEPSAKTYAIADLAREYVKLDIQPVEQLSGKGKSFVLFAKMPVEQIAPVAVMHSQAIFCIKDTLADILKERRQEELYYDIELPLVEVLAGMEYWGFKVDVNSLKEFSVELEEKINQLVQEIYQLAGEEFNINSTKQLGVILFEKLGLPMLKKTKTGYSTDAEVLEQLTGRHQIISKILEYRQLAKLKSTYIEGLLPVINPATGKIHSRFNQTVAVTGRISSTEPNLQNIPIKLEMGSKIRKVFITSDDSFVLSDADYSQIELRVLAHITGDENMISAFNNNEDIHTATASRVFGMPKEEISPLLRSRAKSVNFGIVYGIGDFSLSKDLGITRKEARRYIDEYLDKYSKVKQYMHDIVEEGKANGYVKTLFNRRRYLPELHATNFTVRSFGERIAMNTPIQGSAADIIKIAMVRVYKELTSKGMKSRLILQVHDELIIETHLEEKELVEKILIESMENAAKLSVPMSVEVKTAKNWLEAK